MRPGRQDLPVLTHHAQFHPVLHAGGRVVRAVCWGTALMLVLCSLLLGVRLLLLPNSYAQAFNYQRGVLILYGKACQ